MKLHHIVAGAGLAATVAMPALAEEDKAGRFEVGGGLMLLDDPSVFGATVRAGYTHLVSETVFIGAEAEGNFGFTSEEESGVDIELDSTLAGFLVVGGQSDQTRFFGRIGYHDTTFNGGFGGVSVDVTGNGLAAGLGADIQFRDNIGVRFDATYLHFDELDAGGFTTDVDDGSTILSVTLTYAF